MQNSRTRSAAIAALAFLGLGGLLTSTADASFPGHNGRLAVASLDTSLAGTLQTVNPDGTGKETLVQPEPDLGAVRDPQWSGDGRRLLFNYQERTESGTGGFAGLATFDLAGRTLAKLPHATAYDTWASWSPNGSRVAFTRAGKPDRHGGRSVIYTANVDGSHVRRIADGTEPRFSPDGRTLAYVGRAITVRGRVVGGGIVLRDARTGRMMRPDWAPDGKRLLYTTNTGRVAVVGRDGRNSRLLMQKKIGYGVTVWSPDGKSIAYTKRLFKPGSDEQYAYAVRTRRLKTGAERQVFTTAVLDAEEAPQYAYVSWQPLRG